MEAEGLTQKHRLKWIKVISDFLLRYIDHDNDKIRYNLCSQHKYITRLLVDKHKDEKW